MKKYQKLFFFTVAFIGALLVLASCATPTPVVQEVTREVQVTVQVPVEVTRVVEVTPEVQAPNMDVFLASGHHNADAEAFKHWDAANPAEIPTSCAKCHSSAGFQDFAADGKVDAAVPAPAGAFTCETCHNEAAEALTSVTFPSGKVVETSEEGEGLCMQCHQGRESKVSVDKQINETFAVTDMDAVVAPLIDATKNTTTTFGFRNIHYFAAGATLYGAQAQAGYEYDGKIYDVKFRHVDGVDTCVECHNQHSLEVRIEKCAECHEGVTTVEDMKNARMNGSLEDYNGNGDIKEGIAAELAGLQDILYGSIQAYAKEVAGKGIVYDGAAYPYFFADADGDGAADKNDSGGSIGYNAWTARLLKAAYNYQLSVKDPGAFAHNAKYIIELLYDSTEDLNGKLATPVDMGKLHRDDAGHFAGNTMPFRDWDDSATGVPYRCVKCHTAEGLPQFLTNGGTVVVDQAGASYNIGVGNLPPSNGFKCVTCHNPEAFPELRAVASVVFPSGKTVSLGGKDADGKFVADNANLCIACHQGRESTTSVNAALKGKDADTVDAKISFKNMHYFAAGAALFGTDVKGWYEYSDQTYNGQFTHFDLGPTKCTECHNVHELTVQVDKCSECHKTVKTVEDLATVRAKDDADFDGDGNVEEGMAEEVVGMREALLAAIQTYAKEKAGVGLIYNGDANPYFFLDKDGDGKIDKNDTGGNINFNGNWTPRLMKAAFNYQAATKDPGQFAHNGRYAIQVLYDSIKDLGGDVSKMTRPEAPAP